MVSSTIPRTLHAATLTGTIILEVAYAGRADVSELKLVRADDGASWKVAPDEIERTFKTRHKPFDFRISIAGQPTLWTKQTTRRGQKADTRDNVWVALKRLTIYGKQINPNPNDPLRRPSRAACSSSCRTRGNLGARSKSPT